jgi:hypothetical protein
MSLQMDIEPPDVWRTLDDEEPQALLRVAARFAERAKKVRYHREPLSDHAESCLRLLEGFGGLLGTLSETPTADIWRANVAKLAERYPDGFETADQ